MKLIIAGSRSLNVSARFLDSTINNLIDLFGMEVPREIVSGGANGIDSVAKEYATENWESYDYWKPTPFKEFPADWNDLTHPDAVIRINQNGKEYDATAGHRRNTEMANYADALLVIWDGKSPGSSNMLTTMKKLGKPVYEVVLRKHNV